MTSRRDFLKNTALLSAGFTIGGLNMTAANSSRVVGANKRINLACVGIGNRGGEILTEFDKTGLANIVALCDVDMGAPHTQANMAKFPSARQFKDFRQMFDKMANEIDAVMIGIPDHAHFPVCMMAMALGKHVYVEKPMARTFYEIELLMAMARKNKNLVTQVGNQGHSEANYFQFKAWKEAGIIKDVTAITAHMNSPRRWHGWDTKISKFPNKEALPTTLDWDT